jgi:recombinational DNA repair protein RecT
MAYRTGQIAKINVGVVAEGQEWVEDQLTGDARIEGMPKSNKPIGYFAYMKTFSGREHSLYMSNEDIDAHKVKYAQGYNRSRSAWQTDWHKMAKKTVLSQMLKQWAPLDPTGTVVANLEYASGAIDEMPDPELVTIEERERRPNAEILDDLGFSSDVADASFSEVDPEPTETNAPASIGELKTWAVDGGLEGVSYKDVDRIYKETENNLAETWLIVKEKIAKSSGQSALL